MLVIPSSAAPSPAVSPDHGPLHRLTAARAPLGTGPALCPNQQLGLVEEGQRGEKISLSAPPDPSEALAGPP